MAQEPTYWTRKADAMLYAIKLTSAWRLREVTFSVERDISSWHKKWTVAASANGKTVRVRKHRRLALPNGLGPLNFREDLPPLEWPAP